MKAICGSVAATVCFRAGKTELLVASQRAAGREKEIAPECAREVRWGRCQPAWEEQQQIPACGRQVPPVGMWPLAG